MNFVGEQRTFTYSQVNAGPIDKVFGLLCPVREKDWLDGWDYTMVYSRSGLVEENCVFTTTHENIVTTWYVVKHDPENYEVQFVRVTPGHTVASINVRLVYINAGTTEAIIQYRYTGLNEEQNAFIKSGLEEQFIQSMTWWEDAINHYLATGQMLHKPGTRVEVPASAQ